MRAWGDWQQPGGMGMVLLVAFQGRGGINQEELEGREGVTS